jgi:hypothetical protein
VAYGLEGLGAGARHKNYVKRFIISYLLNKSIKKYPSTTEDKRAWIYKDIYINTI